MEEALSLVPNVHSAVVKEGITNFCAKSLHVVESAQLIQKRVRESLDNLGKKTPFRVAASYELRVSYKLHGLAFYKWIRKRKRRPRFAPLSSVVFSNPENLPALLEEFKAF